MKTNRNNLKKLEKFNKRIEFDSELINRRFATIDKKHQLLLKNQIVLGEPKKRDRNVSNRRFHQMQTIQERVYMDLGIPSLSSFPSFYHFLAPMVCTLDNNLRYDAAMATPKKLYHYSQDDPPEDLDEKFYFDNLTIDDTYNSYKFILNSIFPLTPASYAHTVAYFDYKFFFWIGSSGTYCFLPLTKLLGNISYTTGDIDPSPGSLGITVSYGVTQNGEVLGAENINYNVEINNGEQIPLSLGTEDFNYDRLTVNLESEHLVAGIPVIITLTFYNGSYFSPNADGHFILDCTSQGGEIACDCIKWGRKNP